MPVNMKMWPHADLDLAGRHGLADGKSIARPARDHALFPARQADLDGQHSSEETTRCHFFTEMSVGRASPFLTWVPPL